MAEEPQYKLRAAGHPFWHLLPQAGVEPQEPVHGEGIPGPSLAHPAHSRQEVLPGAWSAKCGFSGTKPATS